MSMTATTAYCRNCGAPDLRTRFCENCGTEMVRAAPTIAIAESQPLTAPAKPGLPLVFLFAGIIGPVVVGAVSSLISLALMSAAYSVPLEIVILLLELLVPVAVVLAGRAGQASMGARVGGLLIVAIGLAIELIVVVMNARVAYSLGAMDPVWQLVFLVAPLLVVLAWLMATGSPASAYRVVWLAAAVALVYFLISYLVPVGGNAAFVWRSIVANLVRAGGLLAVILLIPRFVRIRTATGDQRPSDAAVRPAPGARDAAYAALPRPNSTNGFAVSALIFGLLGGTIFPIVFGHIALTQIGRTGERGRGMATAGLVLGYLSVAVVIVIVIVVLVAAANAPRYY